MARYVDIEPYEDCRIILNKEDVGFPCRDLPTADVAEVHHSSYDIEGFCKICETPIPVTSKQGLIPVRTVRYCHYCGAKMDLRVKGDKG